MVWARLVEAHEQVARRVHADHRIVYVDAIAAVQEVLHGADHGKGSHVDLEHARCCYRTAPPIMRYGHGSPQEAAARHHVDQACTAAFDAHLGLRLRRVGWVAAVAADGQRHLGKERGCADGVGDPPHRQVTTAWKMRVDDEACRAAIETLRRLQMEDAATEVL